MQDVGSAAHNHCMERIVEIPVSFPWVYTLPLPYSLQPHPNILLHFIYCLAQAFTCGLQLERRFALLLDC